MALWDADLEALRPKLREEAATFVGSVAWNEGDTGKLSVAERVAAHRASELGGPPSERAVDRTIDGPAGPIRLRTFTREQPAGVMFHIHGGAWMAGSPEMMDLLHEIVADTCDVAVVSVDYRLAPEHPYPAGPDDCEAAACWLLEHGAEELGSDRLLIAGESAGAHLAAVTLLRMRDRHGAVDRFLGANLVFGAYDLSRTPSQRGVGIAPETDILDNTGFPLDLYLPGMDPERRRDPDVSPLYADLRGLPPALFSVGTNDHLLDDTLFMAARWEAAGNSTELLVYPDTPHGCIALPSVAAHFFPRLFAFVRERIATPATAPARVSGS
ncbi:MAG: alpha/beta hydrolase [Actinobacteria bacterium]|nr:alpha/beta hydrolase [Actinomycetota bacterium]